MRPTDSEPNLGHELLPGAENRLVRPALAGASDRAIKTTTKGQNVFTAANMSTCADISQRFDEVVKCTKHTK